jgi:4-amino-4-deoxy-L-arabinose transferase-like glycosyltransferase
MQEKTAREPRFELGEPLRLSRWGLATVVAIGLAMLLRSYSLGEGFWINEVVSMETARLPVLSLLHRTGFFDIHPPFYYLALSAWTSLFGETEIAVRLLSLLCALGTLVLLYVWGRRHSPWVGFLAVLLLATSTLHNHYSVEVRSNSLMAFLTTAFFLLYERIIRDDMPRLRVWFLLGLVESCLVLTHYYSVPLVIMANVHFFTVRRFGQTRLYRWSVVQAGAFAVFLLWAPLLLVQLLHLPATMYMTPEESVRPGLYVLFLGMAPVHPARFVAWTTGFLVLLMALLRLVRAWRSERLPPGMGVGRDLRLTVRRSISAHVLLGLCLAAPAITALILPLSETTAPLLYQELSRTYILAFAGLFFLLIGNLYNARVADAGHRLPATPTIVAGTLVAFVLLFVLHRPFQPDNLLFLVPPLYLLAAAAWQPSRLLARASVAALVIGLAVPSLSQQSPAFLPRQDFKAAAHSIRDHRDTTDGTANFVLPMWDRPGLEYYLGRGSANGIMSPSQLPPAFSLPGKVNLVLTRQAYDNKRIFLDTVVRMLEADYRLVGEESFRRIHVAIFERLPRKAAARTD